MVRRVVSIALASAALMACRVYDPSLIRPDGGPRPDANVNGLRRPPPRPTTPDSEDVPEVVFALRDVVLDQTDGRWRNIGFDLDGIDTQPPALRAICRQRGLGGPAPPDGEDGIDNVFGMSFFPTIANVLPTIEVDARAAQANGRGNIIMRLRHWNGAPEDPRVEVAVVQAAFATPALPDGSIPDVTVGPGGEPLIGGQPAPPPAWNARDVWFLRDDSFVDGVLPMIQDDNGYVTGNSVVARLPAGAGLLFLTEREAVIVRFNGGLAVSHLANNATTLDVAEVGGRWAVTDLRETAARVGVCPGSVQYEILLNALEQAADVRLDGTPAPDLPCDAISLGAIFRGVRGIWGRVVRAPPLPNLCPARDAGM